jgi:hypothetical protein
MFQKKVQDPNRKTILFIHESIRSQFIKPNIESVHDKGSFLLDHIIANIMIIFIKIALKLAQTFVVMTN